MRPRHEEPCALRAAGAALSVALCTLTSTGCLATPLQREIERVAPRYRAKSPATGDAGLGRRLIDDEPETNACFQGAGDVSSPSFSEIRVSYDDVLGGDIHLDFANVVSVPAEAGVQAVASRKATLTLKDLHQRSLSGLYVDPDGACMNSRDFDRPEGAFVRVITRAIEAAEVDIEESQEIAGRVSIDVSRVGGHAATGGQSATKRTWKGTNLFFADYAECVSVSHQKKTCSEKLVGAGDACRLGACSFQVETLTGAQWRGSLVCASGDTKPLAQRLGAASAARAAPGVTYSVMVTPASKLDVVDIAVEQWLVLGAERSACR